MTPTAGSRCWRSAELAGGHWPERARVAAVAAVAASGVKTVPSQGIQLLEDIKAVFDKAPQADRLLTETLLEQLRSLAPRWRTLDPNAAGAAAVRLRRQAPRVPDRQGQVRRGYRREWFEDAWTRYLLRRYTRYTRYEEGRRR